MRVNGQDRQEGACPARTATRIESIDVLRGVVMVLMALDHVRDFFGTAGNPTDPAAASVALFFTRWITHVCAPVFFLLTGTGACLARRRRSTAQLSRFLLTRGLWLIVLELTVVRCLGYQFNVDYHVTLLVILWALGWSMIALAALVHLPVPVVGAVGVAMIASHNLLDGVSPSTFGMFAPVWVVLHGQGVVLSKPQHIVFAAYPLIPWIGVTAAGYGLGPVFSWTPERRRRFFLRAGIGLTAAFVVLRIANIYGDPVRWTSQTTAVRTILSLLNTTKYPPSLLYLLMTLGPALLFLAWVNRTIPRRLGPALVFGKVPLFYFLLHLPLIHLLAVVICSVRYGETHWMFESARLDQYPVTRPPGWGYSLPVVYLIWIGVVIGLFPLCRRFADLKQRRSDWWLSYL
jgi:uncharacterized membrane protein